MGLDQFAYFVKDDGSQESLGCWCNFYSLDEWMSDLCVQSFTPFGDCLCRVCDGEISFSSTECPHCGSEEIPKKIICESCKISFAQEDDEIRVCPKCGNEGSAPWWGHEDGEVELTETDLDKFSQFIENDAGFKQQEDSLHYMEAIFLFIEDAKAALGKGHKVFYSRG